MAQNDDASREVPAAWTCGAYRPGHDVHFIQARLSWEDGPGAARTIESVADDGTITCADGTRLWNHDPARLRAIIDLHGTAVMLATHGVLRIPSDDGNYCICVSDEPDPCRPETAASIPGESIVDELLRRGGVLRRGTDALSELRGDTDTDRPHLPIQTTVPRRRGAG